MNRNTNIEPNHQKRSDLLSVSGCLQMIPQLKRSRPCEEEYRMLHVTNTVKN
jgi:hypothetical protein